MTTPTYGEQQGKAWPLLLIALAISGVLIYGLLPQSQEPAITSDPESLRAIGWGNDQRNLKEIYTGRGTTIAALGYRSLGDITGCAGSDAQAVQRRSIIFSAADTGIEGCTVSSQGLIAAQNQQDGACLNAIENAVSNWQKNWSDAAAGPYEFLDVGSDAHGQMDDIVDIRDKVLTIERLAGWPIGDPVPGFESSPTVWSGDDSGWRPADNVASCPVEWLQCFDEKEALYAGIPGLETLGGAEGQCIVELSPDRKNNLALYGVFDVMREIAPDAKFVIAAFRVNREDSMSRAADWLIANQKRFNIVAARTSNIMFLETRLLNPGIQNLCGGETWCDAAGHAPYTEPCVGDPYAGGQAYAHQSIATLPDTYIPIARQYERMRDAGIVAIKGTGHEGWKGALPYPDCSPALVSVVVAYAGHMPYTDKPEKLVENGWTRQGWRWDPSAYCEEQSVAPDQLTCVTNNAPGMGYELSDNSVASPLASIHPSESSGANLGNAWTTPYVAATVALLRSDNLAANLTATEVMDLIHQSGTTIMDTRSCTHAPGAAEPDGWFYADADFFGIDLAAPEFTSEDQLSQSETQLLQYPWAYSCSDSVSPDTARFNLDNVPDYNNRRLDVGAAVRKAMERTGTN